MGSTRSEGGPMGRREFPLHLDFPEILGLVTKSQFLENHLCFKMYLLKLIYDHCVIHSSL